MPIAAALAVPLAAQAGAAALQLAQTPVLGWERVETWTRGRKRPRTVIQRSSVSVRAWELAALGVVSVGAYWVWKESQKEGLGGAVPNDFWAFVIGGPVGWAIAKAAGAV